jgi:hypothetical protein
MNALLLMAALVCGTERWAVKTLTDPAATSVNLRAKKSSVAALRAIPAPRYSVKAPRATAEKQAVYIDVNIVGYKLEGDSDLHVVVADGAGATMVVEFPDPDCMLGSRALRSATQARRDLLTMLPVAPTARYRRVPAIPARVTGVVFFDSVHGQQGVAPNGVELHLVTGIKER